VFTTLSATDWAGNLRDFIAKDGVSGALYNPVPGAPAVTTARLRDLTAVTWRAQTTAVPNTYSEFEVPLNRLTGVDSVTIGTFLSPNFLAPATIPQRPTKEKVPPLQDYVFGAMLPGLPAKYAPVSFHVLRPSTKKPKGGYPVAIYGHGLTDNQWTGATSYIAATLAKAGIALIGVEVMGHGYGPGSEIVLTRRGESPISVMSPGRTLPLSPDPSATPVVFDPVQGGGCIVLPGPFATRDCFRQTAVDVFALVKLLTAKNGLASQLDLDPTRISFIGQSFGAILGTMVAATEPNVKTLVLNVGGGPVVDVARLQPPPNLGALYLATRTPAVSPPNFLADFAFRGDAKTVTAPNFQIAKLFEVAEWYNMPGDPLAFASRLKGKSVLFQIALGDMEVPNPTNSNLIRAASGQNATWLYRFDLAQKLAPFGRLDGQPHRFLADDLMFDSSARTSVAIAAQSQVADFINSNGKTISNPNEGIGAPFRERDGIFEVPKALPDGLNYPPLPPGGN
jgi:pimeloyl-ACP methyl ester carboxylesterase